MTKSVTRRAIASASRATLQLLAGAGFRRKANHLFRQSADVFHCIHFQASQWGSAEGGRFTVNFAVSSPLLFTTWTGRSFPANPATALFPVQQRIGKCMPDALDHWWIVSVDSDIAALSSEVAESVERLAPPFFSSYPDTVAIRERLARGDHIPGITTPQIPLIRAMLAVQVGQQREAAGLLRDALREAGSGPFAETISLVAARLGVTEALRADA